MKKIIFLIIVNIISFVALAATPTKPDTTVILRPVNASYSLLIGSSHRTDTYLSPIKYSGFTVGFGYQRRQAMKFNPENWISQLRLDIDIDQTKNMAKNATLWYAGFDFSYSMIHRWKLPSGFSIGVGPSLALNLGCLYLNRNGNNPASAKAAATINGDGYVAWNGNLFNIPITFRYQATVPVIGTFFSSDFGELYYEIYLGNYSDLCHCAWIGNYTRLRHWLTADINLGNTSIQLGYRGDLFSSKANNIVTRAFTHSAVIGLSGEWLSIDSRKKLSHDAKIISATY